MGNSILAKFTSLSRGPRDNARSTPKKTTRIDARTEGYASEGVDGYIEWRGMSPVAGTGDEWRVIVVRERINRHMEQVAEAEKIMKVSEISDTLSFAEAVNRLAVWEMGRMITSHVPCQGHESSTIGRRHFKTLALQRGFVVSTSGKLVTVADAFPQATGNYLRRDIAAFEKKSDEETSLEDMLQIRPSSIVFDEDMSLDDKIQLFGAINLLKKMAFLAEIFAEYSRVKLLYINTFYNDPGHLGSEGRIGRIFNVIKGSRSVTEVKTPDFYDMIKTHDYFSPELIEEFQDLRREFAESVFKAFAIDEADWDKDLDFKDTNLMASIRQDEGANELYECLHKKIDWPIDADEEDALLVVSARLIQYLATGLENNPAYELLEENDMLNVLDDISPMLNYLDILNLKKLYIDLARGATTLAQTQSSKKVDAARKEFDQQIADVKSNLTQEGQMSLARVAELERFISSQTPFYLIEIVESLPARMMEAANWLGDRTLPKPQQLSLDLPLMVPDYHKK